MRSEPLKAAVLGWMLCAAAQAAGSEPALKAEHQDWAVYQYDRRGRPACYLAAPSSSQHATPQPDGEPSWILVDIDPTASPGYTVSFTLGRPLDEAHPVGMRIGKRRFELLARGDTAWAAEGKTDLSMVVAMKRGRRAVVSARTAEGSAVLTSFSLMGFTRALGDATACEGS